MRNQKILFALFTTVLTQLIILACVVKAESPLWQNYVSKDWKFSADFPGAVQNKLQPDGGERFASISGFDMYMIQVKPRLATNKGDVQDFADFIKKATMSETHTSSKNGAEITVKSSDFKDLTAGGLKGKAFAVQTMIKRPGSSQPQYRPALNCIQSGFGRIWMSKQSFYTLTVMPMNPEIHYCSSTNAAKFFQSFVAK